jgi:hypothetical protein
LLFVNITGNWKNRLAHTRQIIIADWLSLSESSWRVFITSIIRVKSGGDNRKKFPLGTALQIPQNFPFALL